MKFCEINITDFRRIAKRIRSLDQINLKNQLSSQNGELCIHQPHGPPYNKNFFKYHLPLKESVIFNLSILIYVLRKIQFGKLVLCRAKINTFAPRHEKLFNWFDYEVKNQNSMKFCGKVKSYIMSLKWGKRMVILWRFWIGWIEILQYTKRKPNIVCLIK